MGKIFDITASRNAEDQSCKAQTVFYADGNNIPHPMAHFTSKFDDGKTSSETNPSKQSCN